LTLDPELPGRLVAGVPRELDRVVARALKRSRAERYPDARALANDLDALLTSGRLAPSPGPQRKRRLGFLR
jgi:hypothetical protein